MKLPELEEIKSTAAVINEFRGINDNVFVGNEYVRDEKNITSDYYPALASRKERQVLSVNGRINNLIEVNGKTIYVKDNELIICNETQVRRYNVAAEQIYRYGAYLLLMPDKKLINTAYDSSDPDSKEVIELETELHFDMNKKCNIYLSDKDAVPFVCIPEGYGNDFISKHGTSGSSTFGVPTIKLHDTWLSGYATTGNRQQTDGTYTHDFGKGNVIIPSFVKTKTISYANNNGTLVAKPLNVVFGSKVPVQEANEGTNYDCYYGAIDDNKIVIKEYNRTTGVWSVPTMYMTLWIQDSTYAATVKDKIKKGDYIKLDFLDSNSEEYTKDTASSEKSFEFYERLKNYVKVENILYDSNQAGIVFTAGNLLEIFKEKGFMKYGSTGGQDEFIPSIYDLRTIIGCPSGDGSIGVNLCSKLNVVKDMPDMDYLTVCDNRVWGCSNKKHEIYACKLGDPSSWHTYAGIASDSYAMTIGSNGDFTGAYTYRGRPYFFKEDLIINIYGDKPSNYQLNEIFENGLEANSPKSLAEINGLLYYKSRQGICRFNGNNTVIISEQLGQTKYYNAVAGATDSKYYVSMKKINETDKLLYVYDTKTDIWSKEDDLFLIDMYKIKDSLYSYDGFYETKLKRLSGKTNLLDTLSSLARIELDATEEKEFLDYETLDFTLKNHGVEFFAETGDIDAGVENKYIQKLGIRFEIEKDAYIRIKIKYDNDRQWTDAFIHTGKKDMDAVNVTLRPHRCKRFKLRVEGQGFVKIHEIKRILNKGSDFK